MDINKLINQTELECAQEFGRIEEISLFNQKKVLDAFCKNRVASRHFMPSTGYGYDDIGKDTLSNVYKDVFNTQAAIVSPLISSGTQAITVALFGLLRPSDTLYSISGKPYDTLNKVISGKNIGSLSDFGVNFMQTALKNNDFDFDTIQKSLKKLNTNVIVYITRSRGYEWREALTISQIKKAIEFVKQTKKDAIVVVDNCYGEFTQKLEPTDIGADIIVGSLIKNPGGGLAPTGGYIAGTSHLIDQIGGRLTSPGTGTEIGSYSQGYRLFYQGLFLAPHIVAQALKGSILLGRLLEKIGYESLPAQNSELNDIIRSIKFDTKQQLIEFCKAIQSVSPIDSFVTPEPWAMPGYENEVIMAAGTFVQGASIELSCDSPIKAPYIAYIQGGLTYEHLKIAAEQCLKNLIKT